MAFLVKRADPKTALLNNVPEGEYAATLVGIGEPTHYGPGHKLKLPLRFQIDGYPGGVVLRRIRLVDHNGEPYAEFGPNTDMAKFLDVAGVEQPDEAIGVRFVVKVTRRGEFSDVSEVLHTCTPQMYPTDIPHIPTPPVIGNSLFVTREWEPECTPQTCPTRTFTDKDKSADKSEIYISPNNGQTTESKPATLTAKDPAVVKLTDDLTYLSDGDIVFPDRHRAKLAETLQKYTSEEITIAWKRFFPDRQARGDNPSFIAKDFVESLGSLCSTIRRQKLEADEARILHDATAARLQAEAEEGRRTAERKRREEESFDPLAEELCA